MFKKFRETMAKKELAPDKRDVEFEKGDFLALTIAAAITMIPVLIGIFALFGLIAWLMF
ncbi:hypothetical protein [Fusibacter bizertensis]|nr:hypothetical protein [Fusibacter bizertensis]